MHQKLKLLFLIFSVLITILVIGFFAVFYEGEKPLIKLSEDITIIGRNSTFNILFSDRKSGLRSISVKISQDGKERTVVSSDFRAKGFLEKTIAVKVDHKSLKLHDGNATLRISALDYSLRKNSTIVSIDLPVDITPPRISPLNASNYINPGGSCVTTFTLSEEVKKCGVEVNDDFFAAYPADQKDSSYYISYFAVPLDANEIDMKVCIVAEDGAGNTSLRAIPFHIRRKTFRNDNIYIGDSFLKRKMPEFSYVLDELKDASPLETFVYVNNEVRSGNIHKISALCKETSGTQLWKGTFLRLNNSATMARFGDRRTYLYGGKIISKSIHLGVDLASTRNAIIEASNSGIVNFTGDLGIFGNTVIIDHGQGLFSFYAHLSNIKVNAGQTVNKGASIGYTGSSGLAGGDHLHYSVIVGHKFVDPQEWWDPHWIRDNIEKKVNISSR